MKSGSRQAGRNSPYTFNRNLIADMDPRQINKVDSLIQAAKAAASEGTVNPRLYGDGERPLYDTHK